MKTWLGFFAITLAIVGIVVPQAPPTERQKNEQSRMAAKLQAIVPELKKRSSVPPRLMTYFPQLDKADDLFVNVRRADSRGYEVVVAFTSDCKGQNGCGYAILQGTTAPLNEIVPSGKWVPVTLRGGIKRATTTRNATHIAATQSLPGRKAVGITRSNLRRRRSASSCGRRTLHWRTSDKSLPTL